MRRLICFTASLSLLPVKQQSLLTEIIHFIMINGPDIKDFLQLEALFHIPKPLSNIVNLTFSV